MNDLRHFLAWQARLGASLTGLMIAGLELGFLILLAIILL